MASSNPSTMPPPPSPSVKRTIDDDVSITSSSDTQPQHKKAKIRPKTRGLSNLKKTVNTKVAFNSKGPGKPSNRSMMNDLLTNLKKEMLIIISEKEALIQSLVTRINVLEESVNARESDAAPVHEAGNIGDTTSKLDIASFWSKFDKEKAFQVAKIIKKESDELKKRDNNLVIFGLPNTSTDALSIETKDEVKPIFDKINLNVSFKSARRLRNKDSNPGPVIVEFNNSKDRLDVLKASKNIRSCFPKIFINKDMTREELAEEKNLRKVRNDRNSALEHSEGGLKYGLQKFGNNKIAEKFYWGIRYSKLVQIKIKSNNKSDDISD